MFDFVKPGGVDVDTQSLEELTELFQAGLARPSVGKVLPMSAAREAHELMAQASRPPGKIVLRVADSQNG